MKFPIILTLALLGAPAFAQQTMSADDFDSYSVGTTLYFSLNGQFYGSEQFLENRKSVWRDQAGNCVNGQWAEVEAENEQGICFLYDGEGQPHCWSLTLDADTIIIESLFPEPDQPTTVLEVSGQDTVPIICTGPSIGV